MDHLNDDFITSSIEAPQWLHQYTKCNGFPTVHVQFFGKSNTIELHGPKDDVISLEYELENDIKCLTERLVNEEISIEKAQHGRVVGKTGGNIKWMKEKFEVNVQVPSLNEQSNIIRISGPQEGVKKAKEHIHTMVKTQQKMFPEESVTGTKDDDADSMDHELAKYGDLEEYCKALRLRDSLLEPEDEILGFPCSICIGRGQTRPKISSLKLPRGAFLTVPDKKVGRSAGRGIRKRATNKSENDQLSCASSSSGRRQLNGPEVKPGASTEAYPTKTAEFPPLNAQTSSQAAKYQNTLDGLTNDTSDVQHHPNDNCSPFQKPNFTQQWLSSHFTDSSSSSSPKPSFATDQDKIAVRQELMKSKKSKSTINAILNFMDDLSSSKGSFQKKQETNKNKLESLPISLLEDTIISASNLVGAKADILIEDGLVEPSANATQSNEITLSSISKSVSTMTVDEAATLSSEISFSSISKSVTAVKQVDATLKSSGNTKPGDEVANAKSLCEISEQHHVTHDLKTSVTENKDSASPRATFENSMTQSETCHSDSATNSKVNNEKDTEEINDNDYDEPKSNQSISNSEKFDVLDTSQAKVGSKSLDNRTVVVTGLPPTCTQDFLIQFFISYGEVELCTLKDSSATIVFTDEEYCDWAVACLDDGIEGLFADFPDVVIHGYKKSEQKESETP